MLVFNVGRTWRGLFFIWPAHSEVQFVWQAAFTDAAAYLDRDPAGGPVAIGGWTPETMDAPTMELTLVRDDLSLRYFDPGRSLIIPKPASDQPARILRPSVLPLDPDLEALLLSWGSRPEEQGSFVLYHLAAQLAPEPQIANQAQFDEQITLLGYDWLAPGEMISYWRVEAPADGSRRIFFHLVDESGQPVAQDDGLGAPAAFWQAGDLIIQRHSLALPADADSLEWRLGIYDPETGRRLLTADGRDYVLLRPAALE